MPAMPSASPSMPSYWSVPDRPATGIVGELAGILDGIVVLDEEVVLARLDGEVPGTARWLCRTRRGWALQPVPCGNRLEAGCPPSPSPSRAGIPPGELLCLRPRLASYANGGSCCGNHVPGGHMILSTSTARACRLPRRQPSGLGLGGQHPARMTAAWNTMQP